VICALCIATGQCQQKLMIFIGGIYIVINHITYQSG